MSHPRPQNDHNNSRKHTPPPVNVGDGETSHSVQEAENRYKETYHPQSQPAVYKRVFAFFGNKDKQPHVANIISLGMLSVTAFLAIYTWQLFNQTKVQSKAATDAATTAEQTLTETKKFDSTTLANQKTSDKAAKDSATKRYYRDKEAFKDQMDFYKKQKVGVDAQIQAIADNQNEFIAQNKPYLQIEVDSIYIQYGEIFVRYNLYNLSNTPVKITDILGNDPFPHGEDTPDTITEKNMSHRPFSNLYVIKGSPQLRHFASIHPYNDRICKAMSSGIEKVYMQEVFWYTDLINQKKRKYSYFVRITFTPGKPSVDFITNENKDVR